MESTSPVNRSVHSLLSKTQFQTIKRDGIDELQAQLLFNRGIETPEKMKAFIQASYENTSDPLQLIDMQRAVTRIQQAIEASEHITVYGDYDADGVTSSALLYRALRTLKKPDAQLTYHIPNRLHDGCGLNERALDMLKARGTSLIITTDCASSDVEQVEYAKQLGIDVIITDHHHPPERRPQAYAMVNPWRPDCTYGERYLCGVGIAFKLTQALYRAYNRTQEEELALLDLVAIGTVADIAPLLGENHTLVRLGMQRLNTTKKPGLLALIRHANLQLRRIKERDIAYALAPRINAAGRMKEASIAFELLITDSDEEANARVAELEQLNVERQQQTEELMRNVREQASFQPMKQVVLVNGDGWHEGIIGLVAGKLSEEINKPVLVLSNDEKHEFSRGSARSQKGFNIIAALSSFSERLERYGGHAQAAGFTIQSDRIEELHTHLLTWKEEDSAPAAIIESTELPDQTGVVTEQESMPLSGSQMVDIVFTKMELLNYDLYKQIRLLSPFGAGNPEPIFKMEGVRLLSAWPSGREGQNLRLRLAATANNGSATQRMGTLMKGASRQKDFAGVTHVDIVFKLESSEDDLKPEVWLKVLDVEASSPLTGNDISRPERTVT